MRLTICRPCCFTLSPFSKHVMLLERQKKSARTHCERPRFMSCDELRSSFKCLQLLIVLSPIVMAGHVRGSAACQGVSLGDILGNTRRSNYIVCNMLIGHSHSSGAGSPALVKLWLRIKKEQGNAVRDVYYCHIEWLWVLQSVPKSGRLEVTDRKQQLKQKQEQQHQRFVVCALLLFAQCQHSHVRAAMRVSQRGRLQK